MKKICLIVDVKGWAFDMIAQKIKKDLSNKYDIRIDYFDMYTEEDMLYECLQRNKDCDLIHFFWRKTLLLFESESFKKKVLENGEELYEYIKGISDKISTCVYDFFYLSSEETEIYKNVFNEYSSNYYVSTQKLFEIYSNNDKYKKPFGVINDICDWDAFAPINLERFEELDRELVIGWVGNSARKENGVDLKGFHTIIKPVLKELIEEGYNIKSFYADRNERWRTPEEMPEYYSEIDICLCTSIHEGTPRPVLEAMTSGVAIISTDVGIVREALGEKQKNFIIGERDYGKNDENIKKNLRKSIAMKNYITFLYPLKELMKSKKKKESVIT